MPRMSELTQPQPSRRSVQVKTPFFSLAYDGESLRRQANKLREEFTQEKRNELLTTIEEGAGNAKTLRAQAELTYYLTMFEVNTAERGTRQMAIGTWVLAGATIGLVVATIILTIVTGIHGV
jgi:hypothetical protein